MAMSLPYSSLVSITALALILISPASGARSRFLLDDDWRFQLNPPAPECKDPNATFPIDLDNVQCLGLQQVVASSLSDCINACCIDDMCQVYQYCEGGACSPQGSCWTGLQNDCQANRPGWISRGRTSPPPPPPPGSCAVPQCDPRTDDSSWRLLSLPHDFVVEGTFSPTADMAHGYLPFGIGWYRKHFSTKQFDPRRSVMYIDFDGIQTASTVWLNGKLLGTHASGYTPSRYFIDSSDLDVGGDNVLAVKADAMHPDGWWYDGGGIYRHVWLTVISTPGPYIAPWGVYAPSQVQGTVTWASDGTPYADSALHPSVEVWNSVTTSQSFTLSLAVYDKQGTLIANTSGSGIVPPRGNVTWTPPAALPMPHAALWHLVDLPNTPSLYTLVTNLSVGGGNVDMHTTRFGVRAFHFDADTGFYLNGVSMKILGTANHQDFAGLGVALPDHLQSHRILKLKDMGVNGWRTAHNPPNVALLDAADEIGFLVWNENHR